MGKHSFKTEVVLSLATDVTLGPINLQEAMDLLQWLTNGGFGEAVKAQTELFRQQPRIEEFAQVFAAEAAVKPRPESLVNRILALGLATFGPMITLTGSTGGGVRHLTWSTLCDADDT